MATDRVRLHRVAWLLAVVGLGSAAAALGAGCGTRVRPDMPFPEEPVMRKERAPSQPNARAGRQVLVGELCPKSADGRPAVAPLLLRTTGWTDAAAEVTATVERGTARRFAAFGVDGKLAGWFDTLGLADLTLGQSVATGAYVGGAPCSAEAAQGQRTDDAACRAATGGCGLAVSELARLDDPLETPTFVTGGACMLGDMLAVDIDGDGVLEGFSLSGVLDSIRSPAQEWSANREVKAPCAPKFVAYDVKLAPEAAPGRAPDPRATVTLDLLGVVDLDGDGRKELVLALRFPTVRTVVIYSASGSPKRLELVGEAQSFQRGQ